MADIFQFVGTLASIGSIPLAIYLFIKSNETKLEKSKIDIVKKLSYQIGENRLLGTFEVDTVIRSKLRENKFHERKITKEIIIEDLVSETISNPLIPSSRKEEIIANLKQLYFKAEIYDTVEKIDKDLSFQGVEESDPEKMKLINARITANLAERLNQLTMKREKLAAVIGDEEKPKSLSREFAIVAIAITLLVGIFSVIGESKINAFIKSLNIPRDLSGFFSIIASLLTAVITIVIMVIKNKIKD